MDCGYHEKRKSIGVWTRRPSVANVVVDEWLFSARGYRAQSCTRTLTALLSTTSLSLTSLPHNGPPIAVLQGSGRPSDLRRGRELAGLTAAESQRDAGPLLPKSIALRHGRGVEEYAGDPKAIQGGKWTQATPADRGTDKGRQKLGEWKE